LTIIKGTTRQTLYNVLIEFIAEGQDLTDLFVVNPKPVDIMRGKKVVTLPTDTVLTGADKMKPSSAFLTNFVFDLPIDPKYAVRISEAMRKKPEEAVLPYLKFKV